MSNDVYANNQEVACKAGSGKSICAFPDVCFTPPENPATPPGVPVPYPNTGMDSDTTDGSRTVLINGKEAMLKNKSYFKKSMGDEAGCAAKKGVATSVHRGKVYFIAWSMDVKFEGENVVRNLDLTTHNHASPMANTPPQLFSAKIDTSDWSCEKFQEECDKACEGAPQCSVVQSEDKKPDGSRYFNIFAKGPEALADAKAKAKADPSGKAYQVKDIGRDCKDHPNCAELQRCVLKPKEDDKTFCCQPSTTGHHLVEGHGFCHPGAGNKPLPEFPNYEYQKAPCVCVAGSRFENQHGDFHAFQGVRENAAILMTQPGNPSGLQVKRPPDRAWTYQQARDAGLDAHEEVFKGSGCKRECLQKQLDDYHKQHVSDDTPLRTEKNRFHQETDQQGQGVQMSKDRFARFMSQFGGG
jgi:hypothetical protein